MRKWFQTFGVPEEISTDGGPEFSANATQQFLQKWGVRHRISSAYHAKSNGRAEVAVKTVKRLMRSNVGASGSLSTDKFLRAMLQLRNTPDPDCGVSPAEIVFGKTLRDNLPFTSYLQRRSYDPRWQEAWSAKENALRARFIKTAEKLNTHSRYLPPLECGERCFIQNQAGNFKRKWHQTGTVMEVHPHDQYLVKVDGSRALTCRNRQFLKKFVPWSTQIPCRDAVPSPIFYDDEAPKQHHTPFLTSHDDTRSSADKDSSMMDEGGNPQDVSLHPSSSPSDRCTETVLDSPSPGQGTVLNSPSPSQGTVDNIGKPKRLPLARRRLQPFLDGPKESPLRSRRRHIGNN